MKQVFWWAGVCMAALLLSACATPTGATQTATQSPPAPVTSASATPLPLGCADAAQSPITSATHIHIQPDHGPVGSQVALVITGAQAHCHLTLNIAVPPALSETQNTPVATPGLSYPVQWITLGADGALTLPYCVCAVIPTWTDDHPQITSVTPQPGSSDVGDYAPKPNDYFFFTLGDPGDLASAPVFAKFIVTG